MRSFIRLGLSLLVVLVVAGLSITPLQGQERTDTVTYGTWVEMMQDPEIPVPDVVAAFERYWENRIVTRGSGWKPFKRWEYHQVLRMSPDGRRYTKTDLWDAYQSYKTKNGSGKAAGSWQILGPVQQPANIGTGQPNGMGRINVLAFHPLDPGHFYAGSASGGLWLTQDGGQSWEPLSDTLPTLGVSSVVIDPVTPSVMYKGTGDSNHGDAPGLGVMKSTNGGFSWQLSNTSMGNRTVGALLLHPTNRAILLAATNAGIFRSIDSASTWTLVSNVANFRNMVFHPTNPDIVYATSSGNFFRSVNNGLSWTQVTSGLPGGNRGVIAVTAQFPNMVYFALTNYQSFKGLYRSIDVGQSFQLQSDAPNIMSHSADGSGTGGQAWYNLAITVDPLNFNTLYVGGVNVWKSPDAGQTWQLNSHWYGSGGAPAVHADCHFLGYSPDGRLWAGNDGGVYYTMNSGQSWTEISSGLAVSQIYKLGQSATVRDRVMTGYQDNGTAVYQGNGWLTVAGGDGMECAVDYTDPSRTYGTYYYGELFRLKDDIRQGTIAKNGSNGINESGAWVSPFILHRSNPSSIFLGMSSIWRSTNVNASSTSAVSWQNIAPNTGTAKFLALEQSPVNNDIFYGSKYNNTLFRSENVNASTPVFTDLTASLPHAGLVKAITAHPNDPNTVCIIQNRMVFRSNNRGNTWTNITGSLPDVPLNTLIHYTRALDGLYIGTDLGVYYRDHHSNDWISFSEGLPFAAKITELEIYYDPAGGSHDRVRASTYGRGLWESGLYESFPLPDFIANQTFIPRGCAINFSDLSGGIPAQWEWFFEGGNPSFSVNQHPQHIQYDSAGVFSVKLKISNIIGEDSLLKTAYITVSDTLLPQVSFSVNQRILCASHDPVHFTDASQHCPDAWSWSFSPDSVLFMGGTSAASPNPRVIFLAEGKFDVSLTVWNQNGSRTLTYPAYIQSGGSTIPFTEDFEQANFQHLGWVIENPNQNNTWELFNLGPLGHAMGIEIFNTNTLGHVDRLITPPLDLSGLSSAYLHFRHAYAQYQLGFSDSLRIYYSEDCGQSWTKLVSYGEDGSGSFATHPPSTQSFLPLAVNDWCWGSFGSGCKTIDISLLKGKKDIKIAFEAFSYLSNNIFIDDIQVSTLGNVSAPPMSASSILHVSPNPVNDIAWIILEGQGDHVLQLHDVTGRLLWSKSLDPSGYAKIPLDTRVFRSGVFILTAVSGSQTQTIKLIKP